MKFKTFELIVGGATLTLQDVQQIHENKQSNFLNNSDLYLIESEIIEERFLWLYCQYNNTELYNSTVWNNSTNTKEHNPRKKNQIECRYQLFICYDIEKKLLYMNDMRKKGFFESYLTQILSRDIKIKNLYSSLDAFQNAVQTLKRIKFVQHNAIFNNTIDQHTPFEQVCNIYGCDAPENMYVELEYNNTPITTLWSFLRRLQRGRNNGEFENIVIVGEDAESIEHSFDFSSVISSRVINPVKDDNGHYDEKEVQTMLLKEIR